MSETTENNSVNQILENEWSFLFPVDKLEQKPVTLSLEPDENARKRLAQRLDLLELKMLKAEITISRKPGAMPVHVSGQLEADLVQPCVVTLEPVPAHIEDNFEAWYADSQDIVSLTKARHDRKSKSGQAEVRILDEQEDPEAIIDGQIDLGELVTQYLSLALNPYPHAPGVSFEVGDDDTQAGKEAISNPFAALKNWKDRLDDKK